MLRLLGLFFSVMLLLETAASAAEVRLKDGTRIRGHIGAQSETAIYFVPESVSKPDVLKPRWISITEIESIQMDPVLVNSAPPQPVPQT